MLPLFPKTFTADAVQVLRVTLTPREGLTINDYGTLTLSIREDPHYPRNRNQLNCPIDPVNDGWEELVNVDGTIVDGKFEFVFNSPQYPGERRYSIHMGATGGEAGDVKLIPASLLTILPA